MRASPILRSVAILSSIGACLTLAGADPITQASAYEEESPPGSDPVEAGTPATELAPGKAIAVPCCHKECAAPGLPTWRLVAQPFDPRSRPYVGLYRRVGERSDLGFQVSAEVRDSFREADYEGEYANSREEIYVRDQEDDDDRYDLSARGELRRWMRRSSKLSLFYGVRLSLGYGHGEERLSDSVSRLRDEQSESHENVRKQETEHYLVGLGVTIGADLRLMDHLSLAVAFAPFGFSNSWTRATWKSADRSRSGEDQQQHRDDSEEWRRYFSADVDLDPYFYVTLYF